MPRRFGSEEDKKTRMVGLPSVHTRKTDEESQALLYTGASLAQLAKLFRMDDRNIADKITKAGIKPVAQNKNSALYAVHEVAPHLVKPAGDFEDYLRKMNPRELPPMLQKEFWQGQTARQRFELAEGELWRTDQVIEKASRVFQKIRARLLLVSDRVESKTVLTDKQKQTIDKLIEETLREMAADVKQDFQQTGPAEEQPEEEDDLLDAEYHIEAEGDI